MGTAWELVMTDSVFSSIVAKNHARMVSFRAVGDGSPLFCFPGAGGNSDIFRYMTAALPEGRPVYAIDMEWLCETSEPFTIEELAAYCLDIIRGVGKRGPYYLCGYSFGGLVAYEIAARFWPVKATARLRRPSGCAQSCFDLKPFGSGGRAVSQDVRYRSAQTICRSTGARRCPGVHEQRVRFHHLESGWVFHARH